MAIHEREHLKWQLWRMSFAVQRFPNRAIQRGDQVCKVGGLQGASPEDAQTGNNNCRL